MVSGRGSVRASRFLWGRRGAGLLIFIAVVEYLVIPQLVGTRDAVDLLGNLRPAWVVLGVGLEALSLLSYSRLTRTVLPERPPSFSWLLRTDLTALAVSHVVPGGTATALRYRLLREAERPPRTRSSVRPSRPSARRWSWSRCCGAG